MPRDGDGVYTPLRDWEADAAASVPFSPERWNSQDEDFAAALNELPLASWTPRMWSAGTSPTAEGVNPGSMMYEDGILYICAEVEEGLQVWLDVSSPGAPVISADLENFADDAAAAIGGVAVNGFYRTGSAVKVRVS